jgi:hypothetical protein
MNRTRFAPLVASVLIFVAGLALGAGKTEGDTSAANTASKILLTVGLLGFVIALIALGVSYLRTRRATT